MFISYSGFIIIARFLPLDQGFKLFLLSCIYCMLMYIYITLFIARSCYLCAQMLKFYVFHRLFYFISVSLCFSLYICNIIKTTIYYDNDF